MSSEAAFRDIKLQWLQLLCRDNTLSDNAKVVAIYIVTTHLNQHTETAWPSQGTIATSLNKSVKTIQRAVRDLEQQNWFIIERGNGHGCTTTYRLSPTRKLLATKMRYGEDKVVRLKPAHVGQIRLKRLTAMSAYSGQKSPPNKATESIKESSAPHSATPILFVEDSRRAQINAWESWLIERQLPDLNTIGVGRTRGSRKGYALPSQWPPHRGTPSEISALDYFELLSARHTDDQIEQNIVVHSHE